MLTYKVFEDIASRQFQDEVENYMTTGMQWRYVQNVSGYQLNDASLPDGTTLCKSQWGFTGFIYSADLNWPTNDRMMEILGPMLSEIRAAFPFDIVITRIRAGMFPKMGDGGINTPHVDFHYPHYTFLYYANDSDGDTVLFNEKIDPSLSEQERPSEFTTLARLSPKKGTGILFNGLNYHSSTPPKESDMRLAINVNFTQAS